MSADPAAGPDVRVVAGDAIEVMSGLAPGSVAAIITDPPYAIGFMGQAWDTYAGERHRPAPATSGFDTIAGNQHVAGAPDAARTRRSEGERFAGWTRAWAGQALRVLAPGGHLAAFGHPRTAHRLAVGIEDAGFELRETIFWAYGQGMPKGQNLARAIERAGGDGAAWQGWHTALKPAVEPIVVARKPVEASSVAANVAAHGTGGLNIDACRIGFTGPADLDEAAGKNRHGTWGHLSGGNHVYGDWTALGPRTDWTGQGGRFPANLVLSHAPGCVPVGMGQVASDAHFPASRPRSGIGMSETHGQTGLHEHSPGTETVERWQCVPGCPVAGLDAQSGRSRSTGGSGERSGRAGAHTYATFAHDGRVGQGAGGYGDIGGASRFFLTTPAGDDPVFPLRYVPKAGPAERPVVDGVRHTTVKPLALMSWLVRLLTPPGGLVLDPFAGSGTTLQAARDEGFDAFGIEKEPAYLPLIHSRLARPAGEHPGRATSTEEHG